MLINENNATAGSGSGNSSQDLGFSVLQRHNQIFRHPNSCLARDHLGQGRTSLAADIYRRYNRSSSPFFRGADFPLVNFFSQTSLPFHSGGSEESLPHHAPHGMDQLHQSVDISPYKPHIGLKRELTGNPIRRTAVSFDNEKSSIPVYPPKSSDQYSTIAADSNSLSRMPSVSYSYSQAHPVVHRRGGDIGDKSSLDNPLTVTGADINKEHFSGAVQPGIDRQGHKELALNSTYESSIARFTPLVHYQADGKTTSSADAVSGLPQVVNPKMGPAFETIAGNLPIPSDAVQSGSNTAQSSIQRAVNRKTGVISQNHSEAREGIHGNKTLAGDQSELLVNDGLRPGHAFHFSSPLVTINRQFTLSSGHRFEGLGLGRKIADCTAGTLSQQGFAGDKIPASSMARFAPLEHNQANSKTAARADAVSGLPPGVSPKMEPAFEMTSGNQLILSDAVQSWNTQAQSSMQRAVNRKTNAISQKYPEAGDNNTQAGEQPELLVNDGPRPGHAFHFSSPLVTINRQFALSLGHRFEGLGIGRKMMGRTSGTLSQQGFAGDKIPASSMAGFTSLDYNEVNSRTAARADAVSGFSPIVSSEMGPAFETIAGSQPVPFDGILPGNTQARSSIQQAINRKTGVIPQKYPESRDNKTLAGDTFANDGLRPSHAFHFSSPLVAIHRQSAHQFEGLGIGRKMIGETAGALSQQGFAGNQPILFEMAQPGNIPAQSSIKRELNRNTPIISGKHDESRDDNALMAEQPGLLGKSELRLGHAGHFSPPLAIINRNLALSSGNRFEGLGIGRKMIGETSGTFSQQGFAGNQPILFEMAQLGNTNVQSSIQRALERQNGKAVDRLFSPGIGDKRPDLKADFHGIESGSKRNDDVGPSADIISRFGDSLLMRSVISSSAKVKPLFQPLLGRQPPDNVSRTYGQRNMPVRHSLAEVTGDLTPGMIQGATIEQGEFFFNERTLGSAVHLPLVQPSVVQRKADVHEEKPVSGEVSAYLQRQDVGNLETAVSVASVQKIEASDSQGSHSDSKSLSTDDIVDKVWRKLMRKLAFEQEKMGGSRRWAN